MDHPPVVWKTSFDFDAALRSYQEFLAEVPWMDRPPAHTPLDGLIVEDPDYDMAASIRKAQERLDELLADRDR